MAMKNVAQSILQVFELSGKPVAASGMPPSVAAKCAALGVSSTNLRHALTPHQAG